MTSRGLCHNQFVLSYQILLKDTALSLGLPDEIALAVPLEEVALLPVVVIIILLEHYFCMTLHNKNSKKFLKQHLKTVPPLLSCTKS